MSSDETPTIRSRILRATLDLLSERGREAVSTRAVSAAAGIQPQTIYRQFGDMEGLLAEAADEGFREYLESKSSRPKREDPVDDLRDGWDLHVDFGVENPALYLLMYGDPIGHRTSESARQTESILRELVEAVARAGRLRIDIESAIAMIGSTGIGVVIALIGLPAEERATSGLSALVREAVIDAVVAPTAETETSKESDVPAVSSMLRMLLPAVQGRLTPGETLLLDEMLTKISRPGV